VLAAFFCGAAKQRSRNFPEFDSYTVTNSYNLETCRGNQIRGRCRIRHREQPRTRISIQSSLRTSPNAITVRSSNTKVFLTVCKDGVDPQEAPCFCGKVLFYIYSIGICKNMVPPGRFSKISSCLYLLSKNATILNALFRSNLDSCMEISRLVSTSTHGNVSRFFNDLSWRRLLFVERR